MTFGTDCKPFFCYYLLYMKIIVNDLMQKSYTYETVAPMGENFHPLFLPELTPKQMLKMGVFEGKYLNDCQKEFPKDWFETAKLSVKANEKYNCFEIKSRLSLSEWQRRGWIYGPDVRGWFQWYCRYYMGRRIDDIDLIQIKRWRSFKRHKIQLEKNCPPMDLTCRLRQRQALLQWAYNPFI